MSLNDKYWERFWPGESGEERSRVAEPIPIRKDDWESRRDAGSRGFFKQDEFERIAADITTPRWVRDAFQTYSAVIDDPTFPCFFAPAARRQGLLRYTFADTFRNFEEVKQLAFALNNYLLESKKLSQTDGLLSSLVVYVRPVKGTSLKEYEDHAWKILRGLHEQDPMPWPSSVPRNPEDWLFSFCFADEPLFVNVSTPEHELRLSRNLGSALVLIFQASRNFGLVPPRVRGEVRKRLEKFDRIAPSPSLGSYGDPGNLEWRQYVLGDDNEEGPARCPFHP